MKFYFAIKCAFYVVFFINLIFFIAFYSLFWDERIKKNQRKKKWEEEIMKLLKMLTMMIAKNCSLLTIAHYDDTTTTILWMLWTGMSDNVYGVWVLRLFIHINSKRNRQQHARASFKKVFLASSFIHSTSGALRGRCGFSESSTFF